MSFSELRWWGAPWGAPVNDDCERIPVPVGVPCGCCEKPIAESDQGLTLLRDDPWHLHCYLDLLDSASAARVTRGVVTAGEGTERFRNREIDGLTSSPSDDAAWLCEHAGDLTEYAGQWVAIVNQKVVSSGEEPVDVQEKALSLYPKSNPLLWRVDEAWSPEVRAVLEPVAERVPRLVRRSRNRRRCRAVGCRTRTRELFDVGVGAWVHLCRDHKGSIPPLKPHRPRETPPLPPPDQVEQLAGDAASGGAQ
jgi:hypothetical protein